MKRREAKLLTVCYIINGVKEFDPAELQQLYYPPPNSHKGQNGKLLIVAGSGLFHAPALWTAAIASRLVDMVYLASTAANNTLLQKLKQKFWDGIVISRAELENYAAEADCILIGPGLPRKEGQQEGDEDTLKITQFVLTELVPAIRNSHPAQRGAAKLAIRKKNKHSLPTELKVVIDGGALQSMEVSWIPRNAILTPHTREFYKLFKSPTLHSGSRQNHNLNLKTLTQEYASKYECIILLKDQEDIVCSAQECRVVKGGNAGMTKGGTGDVLAGLVAALACKNAPFLAACAGSYLNKKAGDSLFQKVGYFFNASDLVNEIPRVMKAILG